MSRHWESRSSVLFVLTQLLCGGSGTVEADDSDTPQPAINHSTHGSTIAGICIQVPLILIAGYMVYQSIRHLVSAHRSNDYMTHSSSHTNQTSPGHEDGKGRGTLITTPVIIHTKPSISQIHPSSSSSAAAAAAVDDSSIELVGAGGSGSSRKRSLRASLTRPTSLTGSIFSPNVIVRSSHNLTRASGGTVGSPISPRSNSSSSLPSTAAGVVSGGGGGRISRVTVRGVRVVETSSPTPPQPISSDHEANNLNSDGIGGDQSLTSAMHLEDGTVRIASSSSSLPPPSPLSPITDKLTLPPASLHPIDLYESFQQHHTDSHQFSTPTTIHPSHTDNTHTIIVVDNATSKISTPMSTKATTTSQSCTELTQVSKKLNLLLHLCWMVASFCTFTVGIYVATLNFMPVSPRDSSFDRDDDLESSTFSTPCIVLAKFSTGTYVLTKFCTYLFLFIKQRLLRIRQSKVVIHMFDHFDSIEWISILLTLSLPIFCGLVIWQTVGVSNHLDATCQIRIPIEFNIVMIGMDVVLISLYLYLFLRRLRDEMAHLSNTISTSKSSSNIVSSSHDAGSTHGPEPSVAIAATAANTNSPSKDDITTSNSMSTSMSTNQQLKRTIRTNVSICCVAMASTIAAMIFIVLGRTYDSPEIEKHIGTIGIFDLVVQCWCVSIWMDSLPDEMDESPPSSPLGDIATIGRELASSCSPVLDATNLVGVGVHGSGGVIGANGDTRVPIVVPSVLTHGVVSPSPNGSYRRTNNVAIGSSSPSSSTLLFRSKLNESAMLATPAHLARALQRRGTMTVGGGTSASHQRHGMNSYSFSNSMNTPLVNFHNVAQQANTPPQSSRLLPSSPLSSLDSIQLATTDSRLGSRIGIVGGGVGGVVDSAPSSDNSPVSSPFEGGISLQARRTARKSWAQSTIRIQQQQQPYTNNSATVECMAGGVMLVASNGDHSPVGSLQFHDESTTSVRNSPAGSPVDHARSLHSQRHMSDRTSGGRNGADSPSSSVSGGGGSSSRKLPSPTDQFRSLQAASNAARRTPPSNAATNASTAGGGVGGVAGVAPSSPIPRHASGRHSSLVGSYSTMVGGNGSPQSTSHRHLSPHSPHLSTTSPASLPKSAPRFTFPSLVDLPLFSPAEKDQTSTNAPPATSVTPSHGRGSGSAVGGWSLPSNTRASLNNVSIVGGVVTGGVGSTGVWLDTLSQRPSTPLTQPPSMRGYTPSPSPTHATRPIDHSMIETTTATIAQVIPNSPKSVLTRVATSSISPSISYRTSSIQHGPETSPTLTERELTVPITGLQLETGTTTTTTTTPLNNNNPTVSIGNDSIGNLPLPPDSASPSPIARKRLLPAAVRVPPTASESLRSSSHHPDPMRPSPRSNERHAPKLELKTGDEVVTGSPATQLYSFPHTYWSDSVESRARGAHGRNPSNGTSGLIVDSAHSPPSLSSPSSLIPSNRSSGVGPIDALSLSSTTNHVHGVSVTTPMSSIASTILLSTSRPATPTIIHQFPITEETNT